MLSPFVDWGIFSLVDVNRVNEVIVVFDGSGCLDVSSVVKAIVVFAVVDKEK